MVNKRLCIDRRHTDAVRSSLSTRRTVLMSEPRRTLSDWAMVGTLLLTIIGYTILTEGRLARLEQKVDDLITFVKSAQISTR